VERAKYVADFHDGAVVQLPQCGIVRNRMNVGSPESEQARFAPIVIVSSFSTSSGVRNPADSAARFFGSGW
jgi:hypothetical protein